MKGIINYIAQSMIQRIIEKMQKKFESKLNPVGLDGWFTFKIGIKVVGQ